MTIEIKDFFPVNVETFRGATRDLPFDVYLKLSEDNICKVFSKSTGLDYKRLAQYIQKGVKQFHIHKEDEANYASYASKSADKIIADPEVASEKKIAALLNMTEQNMAEIFAQVNVSEATAESSQKLVKNYVGLMADNPKTLATLLKLVSHGDYLYYHSIAVSIFSIFIAKATGQFNQQMIEKIGMGGFLHDIGCVQLPKEIVSGHTELNPEQTRVMQSHAKLGLAMIDGTPNIPEEVRYIVYQHHEQPCGKGYPNGIVGDVIYYPAKIVAVADSFSALISKRPFRPAFTVEAAIDLMRNEQDKFDLSLVELMASMFLKPKQTSAKAA